MDKITTKIAALGPGASYFSLEFFPPKTTMGTSNLRERLDRMARALRPLFVTVTWGAGGSTATKSMDLAKLCQEDLGLTTCLHLTCTNMNRALVDDALEQAKRLGIRNVLALRGDPPRSEEYREMDEKGMRSAAMKEDFEWAVDLVRYIRKQYGDWFCIGVAGYPEGHADEGRLQGQSIEHDLPHLVQKIEAGADFIMTQLFFDVAVFDLYERKLREHESGLFKEMPIIPGLMPIQSYQMIKRTAKLSHATLPPAIQARLDAVKGDDDLVKKVGVDIVSEMVNHLKLGNATSGRPQGFHFYTLNLEKAVSFIVERTQLIPDVLDTVIEEDVAIVDADTTTSSIRQLVINNHPKPSARRHSSIGSDPHNRIIITAATTSHPDVEALASEAGIPAEKVNTRANTLAISEGEGALGREATWDDFPNGRWGDARSPAYGEIDGYGVSIHMTVAEAIKSWGYPKRSEDVTSIFVANLEGRLAAIPWSEESLNEETNTIKKQLLAMNQRGWWTVASQPAVNGVRSSDPTFGWGPRNGFVFQKAFVEFFISSGEWETLEKTLRATEMEDVVSFYAINAAGEFRSSEEPGSTPTTPRSPSTPIPISLNGVSTPTTQTSKREKSKSTNAVTWGTFPGKEIITPTIIEEVSFRAWAEEAFGIWGEWERVYAPGSESRRFIQGLRTDVWLVNIICHRYGGDEGDKLWQVLGV